MFSSSWSWLFSELSTVSFISGSQLHHLWFTYWHDKIEDINFSAWCPLIPCTCSLSRWKMNTAQVATTIRVPAINNASFTCTSWKMQMSATPEITIETVAAKHLCMLSEYCRWMTGLEELIVLIQGKVMNRQTLTDWTINCTIIEHTWEKGMINIQAFDVPVRRKPVGQIQRKCTKYSPRRNRAYRSLAYSESSMLPACIHARKILAYTY